MLKYPNMIYSNGSVDNRKTLNMINSKL